MLSPGVTCTGAGVPRDDALTRESMIGRSIHLPLTPRLARAGRELESRVARGQSLESVTSPVPTKRFARVLPG